ncbi:M3 family oligoendopeptidase [Bacillus sp. B-jedd]|uniref:M3 family oligoendopeptidase n=1 Tax=Bacillus sp. B-jedd TaxID=1476857 RepID=UPI00051567C6|nr:M3 family oligoendopeptidase [Bacillus sp. B-jedd]CEG29672.1 oligoendopeptidase [Bacillus sp. B-jedd]
MPLNQYRQNWDLEVIFPGGSRSIALEEHLKNLENGMSILENNKATCLSTIDTAPEILAKMIESLTDIKPGISQASSFAACLIAQNPKDHGALDVQGKIAAVNSRYESILQKVQLRMAKIPQVVWDRLMSSEKLKIHHFLLNEWRNQAGNLLGDRVEQVAAALSPDGYLAWGQFYQQLSSGMKITIGKKDYSVGQAINFRAHPDESVRKEAHEALEAACRKKEDLFAKTINHLAGFRLQLNKMQGINSTLDPALLDNRLSPATLEAMWFAVSRSKPAFTAYLNEKARLLGSGKLDAFNFWAPLGSTESIFSYDEAADFILKHFGRFGPEMESFARNAFQEGWIEAEDRPGKAGHAFCAGFPQSGESRIFLTFGGRMPNMLALAHELGHAFHNHAMRPVHPLHRYYPLCIAETASTFSELLIIDGALDKAADAKEKLFLLDEKLKRSVMNFMNIHSRFLFEKRFYEERADGFVPAPRLNNLMADAIEEAYQGSLASPSVRSWIWTPHYYLTKSPYYNFPYTFGYLFSISLYGIWKERGKSFELDYMNLLRDSGRMDVEDLVKKHTGEDITSEQFWEKGLRLCVKDVADFLKLSK